MFTDTYIRGDQFEKENKRKGGVKGNIKRGKLDINTLIHKEAQTVK